MTFYAKQKGKLGEREAAEHLLGIIRALGVAATGVKDPVSFEPVLRLLADVQAQGGDLRCIPGLSIEVKRQETLCIPAWWRQAQRQADDHGLVPILMFRQNRKPWRYCLPASLLLLGLEGYIEVDKGVFAAWLGHWLLGRT